MSHKCCKKNLNQKKNNSTGPDKFIIGIVVVTVITLGVAIFFGTRLGTTVQVTADSQVAIEIESNRFDWGTIDINDGIVTKNFSIKNTGSSDLKLYNVKTSCMCTTAQLKTPQTISKKYQMHENSSDIIEVRPGDMAELFVEFDPAFHGPSGVGPISRTITISTNETKNPSLTFLLSANVVKK